MNLFKKDWVENFEYHPASNTLYIHFDVGGYEDFLIMLPDKQPDRNARNNATDLTDLTLTPGNQLLDFFQIRHYPYLLDDNHNALPPNPEPELIFEHIGGASAECFCNTPGVLKLKNAVESLPEKKEVILRTPSRGGSDLTTEKFETNSIVIEEVIFKFVDTPS